MGGLFALADPQLARDASARPTFARMAPDMRSGERICFYRCAGYNPAISDTHNNRQGRANRSFHCELSDLHVDAVARGEAKASIRLRPFRCEARLCRIFEH